MSSHKTYNVTVQITEEVSVVVVAKDGEAACEAALAEVGEAKSLGPSYCRDLQVVELEPAE
jgi:hypothetical protein